MIDKCDVNELYFSKGFFFNVKRTTWEKIFMAWKEARLLQEVRNATSSRRLLSETSLKLKTSVHQKTPS